MDAPALPNEIQIARLSVMYSALRTSRMSEMYYADRVKSLQRWTLALQVLIALFATSSPIAGWAFWSKANAKTFWAVFAGTAAVISVVSPFLKLDDKLKTATELATGYCLVTYDLKAVRDEVYGSRSLTAKASEMYEATLARTKELSTKAVEQPSVRVRSKFQTLVNREIPPSSLWIPKRTT